MDKKITNLSDLGTEYQLQLFNEIITDHKFGLSIIDIIDKQFFANESFSKIAFLIRSYYDKHNCLLNFPALRSEINMNIPPTAETFKQQLLDTVDNIQKCNINNLNVQDEARNFCKMQSLKVAVNLIKGKLDKGILQDVEYIEEVLKKALSFKTSEEPILLDYEIDKALSDDYRDPIPTGISGFDNAFGGLAKRELGLVIAPTGIGKSTILSKFGANAMLCGQNVLHIFFEDNEAEIQRKYYSSLTGVPINELAQNRENVKKLITIELNKSTNGKLHLLKLPSGETSIPKIKNIVKRINSQGDKIGVLLLDYLECVGHENDNRSSEEWSNEGRIMRQCEALVPELNLAMWVATQGTKASTSVELVQVEHMGGSIKKAQIAHVAISIGKTLPQKEAQRATMVILKSRVGGDGLVFKDCLFDNGAMKIDTSDVITIQGFESNDEKERNERVKKKLAEIREEREKNSKV